jgi:hypothetical protein
MLKTCSLTAALLLALGCSRQEPPHKTLVDEPVPDRFVSVPAPPMNTGVRYIQTFVAPHDNFFKIEVYVATYKKQIPSGNLLFHLRDSPSATKDLASGAVPLSQIGDNTHVPFQFAPIANSAGKSYALFLDVDSMPPGFLITLWLTPKDVYPDGTFYLNGQAQPGDAALRLYSIF